jgi:hypothetical protein
MRCRDLTVVVVGLALGVGAVGCGGDDTGDGASSPPMFGMSADEITATFDRSIDLGTNVNTALESNDFDLFMAQFQPGAKVIDPIDPSLTPAVGIWFRSFRGLCSHWGLEEVLVNQGGSLAASTCEDFYLDQEPVDTGASPAPRTLRGVRHLTISDGLATELMHRLDAETLEAHPTDTVLVIGFPESRSADVSGFVAGGGDFIARFESAWASRDAETIAALYSPRAIREDAYVGDLQGTTELTRWLAALVDRYPDIALTTEAVFASGRGPAAIYALTMTDAGHMCSMRLGSVWDLDDDGLVDREFVYYDPDTVFSCGWSR